LANLFDNTVVEVPIDDIRVGVHVRNIRTHFDEARIRELADSIHRDGLMNPLVIMETEDESGARILELVAGERRLRAIQYICSVVEATFMDAGVPCITYVGTLHEAEFVNASENIDREDVDEVDTAAWLHRRTEEGVSQQELADKLHRSLPWVNFRVLFHERAVDELKQLLREGLISFTAASELSKNLGPDDQRKRVERARKFNEKISLQTAQNAGNPNKTARPGKRARTAMLAKAEEHVDTSPFHRGAAYALRWTDGLLADDEMEEALEAAKLADE